MEEIRVLRFKTEEEFEIWERDNTIYGIEILGKKGYFEIVEKDLIALDKEHLILNLENPQNPTVELLIALLHKTNKLQVSCNWVFIGDYDKHRMRFVEIQVLDRKPK